jgi:hypothetical protein
MSNRVCQEIVISSPERTMPSSQRYQSPLLNWPPLIISRATECLRLNHSSVTPVSHCSDLSNTASYSCQMQPGKHALKHEKSGAPISCCRYVYAAPAHTPLAVCITASAQTTPPQPVWSCRWSASGLHRPDRIHPVSTVRTGMALPPTFPPSSCTAFCSQPRCRANVQGL